MGPRESSIKCPICLAPCPLKIRQTDTQKKTPPRKHQSPLRPPRHLPAHHSPHSRLGSFLHIAEDLCQCAPFPVFSREDERLPSDDIARHVHRSPAAGEDAQGHLAAMVQVGQRSSHWPCPSEADAGRSPCGRCQPSSQSRSSGARRG